jgi:O-antigen/teichoic acid export membrane protein
MTDIAKRGVLGGLGVGRTARKLTAGSVLRVIALVATGIVSISLMPFIVRTLGDETYGLWSLVATVAGYYGLLDLGLSSAVSRHMASSLGDGNQEQCNRVFNTALGLFSLIGMGLVFLGIVTAVIAPLFFQNKSDSIVFTKVMLILTFNLALSFPIRVYIGALESHLRFDITATLALLSLGLRTGLVVSTLLLGFGIVGVAWATFLSGVPSAFLYTYFLHRELPFLRPSRKYWRRDTARLLLSYGVFSAITAVADTVRFEIDAVVVAVYLGLAAVTHYRIATTLVQSFTGVMLALVGVFSAVFSRLEGAGDYDGIKNIFFFATKLSMCVSSFVGFGLIFWGKAFIKCWVGEEYLDAYPCLAILAVGFTISHWQASSVRLFYGLSRHKIYALFTWAEAIGNLVLSLSLVRKYGMFGVAFGTFLPMALTKLFVQPFYACHVLSIPFSNHLRRMAKTFVLNLGALIVPFLLTTRFASPNYANLFALGTASLGCYVLFVLVFEFTAAERQLFKRVFSVTRFDRNRGD